MSPARWWKPAREGAVEAWGRSRSNPVGGWYGLKKGLRGRFGVYVPPLMEALGLAELEHNAKTIACEPSRTSCPSIERTKNSYVRFGPLM